MENSNSNKGAIDIHKAVSTEVNPVDISVSEIKTITVNPLKNGIDVSDV